MLKILWNLLLTVCALAAHAAPDPAESITINNRVHGELANAMAALELFDTDPAVRLASAQKLKSKVSAEMAPLLAAMRALAGCVGVPTSKPGTNTLNVEHRAGFGYTNLDYMVVWRQANL